LVTFPISHDDGEDGMLLVDGNTTRGPPLKEDIAA
jgi:hypothetical protein